jgi:pilus assembly protein CpaF
VTCVQGFRGQDPLPDVLSPQCRRPCLERIGEIKMRRLVKEASRVRGVHHCRRSAPGERGSTPECSHVRLSGDGSIHANFAREAITKVCTLPLLAGENVTQQVVAPCTNDSSGCLRLRRFGFRFGRVHPCLGSMTSIHCSPRLTWWQNSRNPCGE